ncbi:hypothetical protein BDZ45DRAFT_746269 [Acephala macrosclerotiorum]|nr:hypothetical protein BDZ45DRAFT_746269 [Acephala macrosclerotiorum]
MSLSRHRLLLALFAIGLSAVMICVAHALWIVQSDRHLSISLSGLWRIWFGSNTQTSGLLVNLDGSPASLSVTSNIPQLFLAIVTLFTNAAFVEMTQADEYVRFLTKRATLRVSNPSGKQRGTYLLGMPYRYVGPMLAITSASVVLVYTDSTSTNLAQPYVFTTSNLSFSPLAIVVSFVLAGLVVVTSIYFGFKRLQRFHLQVVEFLKVKWGVVEPGHCSFSTSNLITEPEEEIKYK